MTLDYGAILAAQRALRAKLNRAILGGFPGFALGDLKAELRRRLALRDAADHEATEVRRKAERMRENYERLLDVVLWIQEGRPE